jgi:Family of unknown function (DUF5752)
MENRVKPFEFKLCFSLLRFTGKKAKDLRELREGIASANDDCIFHHTYQYFLKGPTLEYTNDFGHWAGESLEERALAEHLSNVDPFSYGQMQDLKQELVRVIDDYLTAFPEPRKVFPGEEFFFNETVTFVAPLGIHVKNLAEFLMAIKYIDPASIYYHFYEAKVRLSEGVNDFSAWIKNTLDKRRLAENIENIDPFMHTLEEIREHIAELVEKEARQDMEGLQS